LPAARRSGGLPETGRQLPYGGRYDRGPKRRLRRFVVQNFENTLFVKVGGMTGYTSRDLVPASNPHRDDIVGRIFEDMLSGLLKREDVPVRISRYVAEFNKLYPTKYAKFGDGTLLSLDEVLFDDGTATRADTVSRGLWD